MKNILFILGVVFLFFSCKKDKIGGFSTFTDCPGMYDYRSSPLDLSVYDSVNKFYDMGCWGMEPILPDTSYNNVTVNPKNPYEVAYVERLTQSYPEYSLYRYNFCTNTRNLIYNGDIYGGDCVSWSAKNKIFIWGGEYIRKMNSDGSNLTTVLKLDENPDGIHCNPDGTLFTVAYSDAPSKDINKVYTENGDQVFVLPHQADFLGWYDSTHVLTCFDNQVTKTDVFTGSQEVILNGNYYSYDYKSEKFFKSQDSSGYIRWLIYNKSGGVINEMPYHYVKGLWYAPKFVANNKIIAHLSTTEFYPDKHTPSCQLFQRERIAIMNTDGSDVRVVNFPE